MIPLIIKSLKAGKAKKPTPAMSGKFAGLLAILAQHNPDCKFGPDDVKEGDTVTFKAGTFTGSGKVTAAGKHGATVEDSDARPHSVRWHEVTGHVDPKGKKGKKAADASK